MCSVAEGQVDVLAGMGPPAPAEDLPLRLLAAGEDGLLLDLERAVATGRHQPEHPAGKGAAADEDHLPAARIVTQDVQQALQAGRMGADGLATEFLDVVPVRLRIDLVDHRASPRQPARASCRPPQSGVNLSPPLLDRYLR